MNVKINASGYSDKGYVESIPKEGNKIKESALDWEDKIIQLVEEKITK